jgi:hypothetical protein
MAYGHSGNYCLWLEFAPLVPVVPSRRHHTSKERISHAPPLRPPPQRRPTHPCAATARSPQAPSWPPPAPPAAPPPGPAWRRPGTPCPFGAIGVMGWGRGEGVGRGWGEWSQCILRIESATQLPRLTSASCCWKVASASVRSSCLTCSAVGTWGGGGGDITLRGFRGRGSVISSVQNRQKTKRPPVHPTCHPSPMQYQPHLLLVRRQ